MAYSGYSGEIPTWEMGYTRDRDVDIPNLGALLKGRAPGPVRVWACMVAIDGFAVFLGVSPSQATRTSFGRGFSP